MSARFLPTLIAACAFTLANGLARAALGDSERQLPSSGMSAATATQLGETADASGLARIVSIGDAALVRAFDYGLRGKHESAMPPDIEALLVKNFNDARVGAALRALTPRYRTRAIFDLHYARLQAAYRSDEPSFAQILRTDQPGIDEPLLAIASRFPTRAGELNPAVDFLARRKHPGAVPLLVAALEASFGPQAPSYSRALDFLLEYPSIDAWRRANGEVERLRGEGRVPDAAYARARARLDPIMADPEAVMARIADREVFAEYERRRDALFPNIQQIAPLWHTDLPRYVDEQARFLEKQEAIAAVLASERVDYFIAGAYGSLGAVARFRLNDPARALPFLEKAAKGRDLYGQIVLADTYQLALRDKANALRAYELALQTASERGRRFTPYARPGDAMNEFWKAWLAQEIAFLRTGKPFHGRVPEEVIAGFWESMWVWARSAAEYFPDWAPAQQFQRGAGFAGAGTFGIVAAARAPSGPSLAGIDRKGLGARLAALPPSRIPLFVALRYISALPDGGAILHELARHDPSGYWTTIVAGTVAYHEARGATGREEAARNGVADALPGLVADGSPTPLASAARRYLQSRQLRAVEKKP